MRLVEVRPSPIHGRGLFSVSGHLKDDEICVLDKIRERVPMVIGGSMYEIDVLSDLTDKTEGYRNHIPPYINTGKMFLDANTVTMEGVAFPLQVLFLNEGFKVINKVEMKPGQHFADLNAQHFIEIRVGAKTRIGEQLRLFREALSPTFFGKHINHSNKPNAYMLREGKTSYIYGLREILPNEEITLDYNKYKAYEQPHEFKLPA